MVRINMIQKITQEEIDDFLNAVLNTAAFEFENKERIFKLLKILFNSLGEISEELIEFDKMNLKNYNKNSLDYSDKLRTQRYYIDFYITLFGIDLNDLTNIDIDVKYKLIYFVNELFRTKGSINSINIFANMLKEFTGSVNAYNIVVETTDSKYKDIEREILTDDIGNYFKNFYGEKIYLTKCIVSISGNYILDPESHFYDIISYNTTDNLIPSKIKLNDEIFKLEYSLDILHTGNPNTLLKKVGLEELRHPKFIMQIKQFVQTVNTQSILNDTNNVNTSNKVDKYNVFPIRTNLIYLQYNINTSINTYNDELILDDLIHHKANILLSEPGTKIDNYGIDINLDNYIHSVNLKDLYLILNYIELKKHYDNNFNLSGKVYTSLIYNFNDINEFSTELLEINELIELYPLIKDKESRELFNFKYDKFRQKQNIPNKLNTVISILKYLKNDITPGDYNSSDSISELYDYIDKNNPFKIPNFKETVIEIVETFELDNLNQVLLKLEELFYTEYKNLLNSMGESTNIRFMSSIDKYLKSNESDIPKLLIEIHRQIDLELLKYKTDPVVKTFFNNLFFNMIIGKEYKRMYINPLLNLFKKYFFNAELIIKESSFDGIIVNDNTQNIFIDDKYYVNTSTESVETLPIRDSFDIKINDKYITDEYKPETLVNDYKGYVNITQPQFKDNIKYLIYENHPDPEYNILKFNVNITDVFGNVVNPNVDIIINLKLRYFKKNDPLFKKFNIKLKEDELADKYDTVFEYFNVKLIKNSNTGNTGTIEFKVKSDKINEKSEYLVLESYNIMNANTGLKTNAQFNDIVHTSRLIKIKNLLYNELSITGNNIYDNPLCKSTDIIYYDIHQKFPVPYDTSFDLVIKHGSNLVGILGETDDDDFNYLKIPLVIKSHEQLTKFKLPIKPGNINNKEYFHLSIENLNNPIIYYWDILYPHDKEELTYGIMEPKKLILSINPPESIDEKDAIQNIKLIGTDENGNNIDLSKYNIDMKYFIKYYKNL